jgi:hypothetical protein
MDYSKTVAALRRSRFLVVNGNDSGSVRFGDAQRNAAFFALSSD